MKHKRLKALGIMLFSMVWGTTVFATAPNAAPTHSKHTMTYKNKTVNYIKMTLDDQVKVDIELANEQVNSAVPLKSINDQGNGFAAINGTYFSAYNGDMPLPYGTVIKDGEVLHKSTVGATIGFTAENTVVMDYLDIYLAGYLNGNKTWYAWNVNRPTTVANGVTIFTDEYVGNVPMPEGSVAAVTQNNQVIKHITTTQEVPKDGFIVVYNPGVADRAYDLSVGSTIEYKAEYTGTYTESAEWDNVITAISAGPSMILEGQVTNQPKEEGFTEAKITTNAGTRSFIGFKEPNILVIGTVGGATIDDMLGIAQVMGLKGAMCLDGGGSSALYYKDAYVSGPGRNINNGLVFSAVPQE